MESALRIWTMLFPSQAADRIFSSSSVRLFEHVFALFCPRACTVKDADGGHKACAITARMSGHQQHVPYANIHTGYRSGQGYEEASAREKLVNPSLLNFRGPGVHKNGIVGIASQMAAIAASDCHGCIRAQVSKARSAIQRRSDASLPLWRRISQRNAIPDVVPRSAPHCVTYHHRARALGWPC